ncbi:ATP-binding protein [Brevibacillus centrosporus]|uniref:ATP-binding protein n=1 Tax=Brevibacillus centrosporus TaxID=54910 RepID=UPI002E203C50|nr:ATP-binding protein [Brevibacillus centrosporus]
MSKKYGFKINRLILSNDSELRDVSLYEGLNVISGPTDTGKTYIFQCIKYLLGSNDPPKKIPENANFYDAYLEIESFTAAESTITLRRTLGKNKIYIYSCSFDKISEAADFITVNTKGSAKLVSNDLLDYMGFDSNIELRTHVRDEKFRKLAFRDFLHFSLIDEEKVIKEKSVLTTGQYVSATVELNAFFYFLTGKYTSYISYLSKQKSGKTPTKAKDEDEKSDLYLDELIMETRREIESLRPENAPVEVAYKEEMLFVTSEIEEQSNLLKASFDKIEKFKSKRLMNQELINRFVLLREQFQSDLQRLGFILEGGSILSNLETENCPTCGKRLDDFHNDEHHTNDSIPDINYEKLFLSYNSEKEKILLNIKDLNVTLKNIEDDNTNINSEMLLEEKRYLEIKQNIENELKPTQESLQEKIHKEVDARLIRAKLEYLTNQLIQLNIQKERFFTINVRHESLRDPALPNNTEVVNDNLADLTMLMNEYLLDMNFPDLKEGVNNVTFDDKGYDFIINGKARSVYGKGYRSIIYSVFVISLMVYCQKNHLPHVGFVLIDSPLTTYQEAGELTDAEKIPEELKERFIETFSKVKESQIIILENKFSMNINNDSINFIEFTKDKHNGRYGFM